MTRNCRLRGNSTTCAGAPKPARYRVIANPKLRDLACQMARQDSISPAKAGALPHVARVVTFTVANLAQMPSYLQNMKTVSASGFSVGACYASSSTYSIPVYWIIVATYF